MKIITHDKLLRRGDNNPDKLDMEMQRRYGRRYLEYRRQYSQAGEFKYEPGFPLYLMLEQTFRCNLKCPLCIHGFPEHKERFNTGISTMPRTLFERIVIEAQRYGCPSIAFHNTDEPLLVKDLPERVAFAREHGFMDLFLTTNGNLLFPAVMRKLIKAGITRILFSLDAATERTYNKLRPGGDYQGLLKNLSALIEYKKEERLTVPSIRLSFVANSINTHEIKRFIKLFSKKVDSLEIQPFITFYGLNTGLIPKEATNIRGIHCNEPWRKLVIRANGDVLPCCSYYGYEIILGNCLETPLRDIFQNSVCRQLRSDFKDGRYRLTSCLSCSRSYYGIKEAV